VWHVRPTRAPTSPRWAAPKDNPRALLVSGGRLAARETWGAMPCLVQLHSIEYRPDGL
jgi:hypothetical protein